MEFPKEGIEFCEGNVLMGIHQFLRRVEFAKEIGGFSEGNVLMNIFNILMFLQFSLSNFSIIPTNFSDEKSSNSEEG